MSLYRDVIDYFYNIFVIFEMFQDDNIYKFLNTDKFDDIEEIFKFLDNPVNKKKIDNMFVQRFEFFKQEYKEKFNNLFSKEFLIEYLDFFDKKKIPLTYQKILYGKESTHFALLVYSLLLLLKLKYPFYLHNFSSSELKKGKLVSEYSVFKVDARFDGSMSLVELEKFFLFTYIQ